SAERLEIGQSAGIEFSVDGLGELGLAGPIMSERQQPDNGAARLLLAVTGQQCFEGALIGAAREELLTIDQVEQGHWLAAQGMDDVPVIDDVPCFRPRRSVVSGVEPRKHSSRSSYSRTRSRWLIRREGPNRTPSSG